MDDTETERIIPTGLILSFLHMARAIGATIRTVETLSINADMIPAKRDMRMVTHIAFSDFDRRISARSAGIPESIK